MQDKLEKTLEILFEPKINSLKLRKITLGCYRYINFKFIYLELKMQRPMIWHNWLQGTKPMDQIIRYTYWTREIGEPISSIT
jgi:hypothetical protein